MVNAVVPGPFTVDGFDAAPGLDAMLELVATATQAVGVSLSPVDADGRPSMPIAQIGDTAKRSLPAANSDHMLVIEPEPAAGVQFAICLFRTLEQPAFTAADARTVARLRPWVNGWIALWWHGKRQSARLTVLRDAISTAPFAIMVVGSDCRLLEANSAALALLGVGDGLVLADRRIRAVSKADRVRLGDIVSALAEEPEPHGAASSLLVRRRGRLPLAVAALHSEPPAVDDSDEPVIILHVLDPELDVGPQVAATGQLFKFSPTETRLVQHLVAGRSLAEAAQRMRVQHETARVYLRQVFAKTGVNRQANLMRLMLLSMVPGRPDHFGVVPPNRVEEFSNRGALMH